jgi:hypothetical protein
MPGEYAAIAAMQNAALNAAAVVKPLKMDTSSPDHDSSKCLASPELSPLAAMVNTNF